MLPVEKQENRLSAVAANTSAAAASGFGKVLGSIQGLQQRLNDFTLDDIIGAESNLKSLMQQVILMRDRLDAIAETKLAIASANQLILEIPEENFDLVSPDSLEKHPKLHAIVKASKLIRLQKLMMAARASADAVSFDADAGMLHIDTTPAHTFATPLPDEPHHAEEILIPKQDPGSIENFIPIEAADQGQAIVIEAPADWPFEATDNKAQYSSVANVEIPTDFKLVSTDESSPLEPDVKLFGGQEVADANPPSLAASDSPIEAIVENTTGETTSAAMLVEAPAKTLLTEAPSVAPSTKPDAGDAERRRHLSRKEKKLARQKKQAQTGSTIGESKISIPSTGKVNRQLLDELIENYGDFAQSPNLPAPVEMPNLPAPVEATTLPALVEAQTLPQTIAIAPTVMPAPEFKMPIQETRNAPNLQKAGELDRQLKKIIKDYGEYDLYSKQQSAVNLKTGGIVVFLILGLVLGGLYFFKTPTTVGSLPRQAVTQPTQVAPADSLKTTVDAK